MTASLLRSGRSPSDITASMFTLVWTGIVVGLAWHPFFPVNKNIWTSSYVVFTSGAALSALAICYWTIDVKGWKRWARR